MIAKNNIGRSIGALLLIQFIGGIFINAFLTAPLSGSPGFLLNGAIFSQQIGAAALASIALSGLSVVIAVLIFSDFYARSKPLALGFLGLSIAGLSSTGVESLSMMSLVNYSQAYTEAVGAGQGEMFEPFKVIVGSIRYWAHYTHLVISGVSVMVFFITLYRFSFVPRVLAGFGILATSLQLIAVSLPFFGLPIIFQLLAPIALAYLAISLWLMVKGLRTES